MFRKRGRNGGETERQGKRKKLLNSVSVSSESEEEMEREEEGKG